MLQIQPSRHPQTHRLTTQSTGLTGNSKHSPPSTAAQAGVPSRGPAGAIPSATHRHGGTWRGSPGSSPPSSGSTSRSSSEPGGCRGPSRRCSCRGSSGAGSCPWHPPGSRWPAASPPRAAGPAWHRSLRAPRDDGSAPHQRTPDEQRGLCRWPRWELRPCRTAPGLGGGTKPVPFCSTAPRRAWLHGRARTSYN